MSRYVPFDPKTLTFAEDYTQTFHAMNLSALPATLIESELFGHRRGAFTGAVHDHKGRLEVCSTLGTVFLDEIGDLDAAIQVKLLRVLQNRTFQALGDTHERYFHGKLIAATNRNLSQAMQQGQFREDFYYRVCSDVIHTPALHEQLRESPGDLTAEEVLRQYCTMVYAQTGSYEETARRVQLDRRTVKSTVDAALLQRLQGYAERNIDV